MATLRLGAGRRMSSIGNPAAWRKEKIIALIGKICFGAFDLGAVNDFSSLALFFPKQKDVPIAVLLLWAWVPEEVEQHNILKERYGYREWVAGEFLKVCPGARTDYSILREDILALDRQYRIQELAHDPLYATQLVNELMAEGMTLVEHRQGTVSMTGPIKEFQRQIIGRDFVHGMNPLLTFMVDNLVVKNDGKDGLSCQKPSNPMSPRKVDGAVAAIMAIGRAAANPGATANESPRFHFI
jgi:phage terminase large subunit-like protein